MAIAYASTREVALAIKNKLLADNVLPTGRVVIAARRFSDTSSKADHLVAVRPNEIAAEANWEESKGRQCTVANRTMSLDVYSRIAVDDIMKDEVWALEHFDIEDAIIDSLMIYQPVTGSGDGLTVCPLHFTGITHPEKLSVVPGWGTSTLNFSAEYVLNVDQRLQ